MFVRNGEVLGSVLNSALPGAKSRKREASAKDAEPPADSPPAVDDESTDDVAQAEVEPAPDPDPEPAPVPEPKKAAPAKKAAGTFKSVLDKPKG